MHSFCGHTCAHVGIVRTLSMCLLKVSSSFLSFSYSHYHLSHTPFTYQSPSTPIPPQTAKANQPIRPLTGPGLAAGVGEGALDVGARPLEEDVAAVDRRGHGAHPDLDVRVEALALF